MMEKESDYGPERGLPDGQVKVDEEQADEDSALQSLDRAKEIEQQFDSVVERTVRPGVVKGIVKSIEIEPRNDKIIVAVDLPGEPEVEGFTFKKPKSNDDTWDFNRWVNGYGYALNEFSEMIENNAEVDVRREEESNTKGTSYELVIPDQPRSPRKQATDKLRGFLVAPFAPVFMASDATELSVDTVIFLMIAIPFGAFLALFGGSWLWFDGPILGFSISMSLIIAVVQMGTFAGFLWFAEEWEDQIT